MEKIEKIYSDLTMKHYGYYCSCYYTYVLEAIKNTIKDLNITTYKKSDIEMIHKHITENYI